MNEIPLKYGCNPNQVPSRIFSDGDLPIEVLSGNPGYINFLDAFNSWQLVCELREAFGIAAAASFKHVSPAGAALGLELSDTEKRVFFAGEGDLSPIALAYVRARGADRMCSFGDFIALSEECDESCARMIRREVSDGVIAPSYTDEALKILKKKRNGAYNIIRIDKDYKPGKIERREVFGITFEQGRNEIKIDDGMLRDIVTKNAFLPDFAKRDLMLSLITLKYTQSNAVCYAKGGQTVGVGAGQQSRVHCTRLAGDKADVFYLRRHPKVLDLKFADSISRPDRDNAIDTYISGDSPEGFERYFKQSPEPLKEAEKKAFVAGIRGVSLGSDAFFPFGDSLERAYRSGVDYVVQAGGSVRDDLVIATADGFG
ncbi:MAG: phosphoribosylaminoimidazolecarboxamide formyltransferase, partial [Oscillospiraceae bacterium]|nr:phosphoribosylaminoimidazolecarboxamide formyltransferase [Oscillospiraceae bacterium]